MGLSKFAFSFQKLQKQKKLQKIAANGIFAQHTKNDGTLPVPLNSLCAHLAKVN